MNVVVLGGGESGFGAAYLAKKHNHTVFVSDFGAISDVYKSKLTTFEINFEEGQHTEHIILNADLIVKSPGIPNTVSIIKQSKLKGIEVISEIEWAYRHITQGKIIAITGSNGKTTTTSLMYDVLKQFSNSVCLAGNIGTSLSYKVAENVYDYYALELSSFQLDDIVAFQPDISILLNLSADHLDRYDWKMNNYVQSKFRITKNQTSSNHFIYWNEGEFFQGNLSNINPMKSSFSSVNNIGCEAYFTENEIVINKTEKWMFNFSDISLQGKHNYMNVMAVGLAAQLLKIPKKCLDHAFSKFSSVEHRLEYVRTIDSVQYINDSKATNVDAVYYALDTFKKPIVWIAGGIDKGNDYSQIEDLVIEKVKVLICIGEKTDNFIESFESKIPILFTMDMKEAVNMAREHASQDDVVLLSPACSSFDLFNNYGHRGLVFKEFVHKLN